jgi:HPt (histidine-containing phosphotransfer) domain-containing protein
LPRKEGNRSGHLVALPSLMILPATEPCRLDPSVMAAIRSLGEPGEPDVFAEVTALFLADVPIHLSALGAAIATKNVDAVYQIAHRLKGSSLEMGAIGMAPVCATLEQVARAGSLEQADAQFEHLNREFEATRRALALAIA